MHVLMHNLHDKAGAKECTSEKEFLRTYRMNRKSFKNMVNELKEHYAFINGQNPTKENKETLEKHLLYFLNFIGTFGYGSSNDNSRFKYDEGSGTHENYRNRTIDAITDNMKYKHCNWPDKNEKKDTVHQTCQKMAFQAD